MSNKVTITGISTSTLPKLTAKESESMIRLIKAGRSDLRETFLMANARLVLSMVQRFGKSKENADDLFQVGMLGLMKAVDNFDVSLDVRFSTYAVPMVLGEIRRYVREGTAMKVGRNLRDIAYRAVQARDRLERAKVKEVSLAEIAAEIDVPYREVVSALDAIAEPLSIYDPVFSDTDDGMLVLDQIKDKRSDIDYVDRLTLREGIKSLPEREKLVVLYRYFMGKTQTEIADALKMSQAQVSRLEKNAIGRLKEAF
ncbi:MAG: sigma-70 family RNA polymerase sigma factor [Clostridia bacterium]|nr:sigma-70 family RNA polymerase sigma factor [Clostridia bacterium]